MPIINYRKQFASSVESGEIRQAIRPIRKYPIKPGDKLYLYTGLRTKRCRKLGETTCKSVKPIQISRYCQIFLDEEYLNSEDIIDLARADGFQYTIDFFDFFGKQYGLPFIGVVIQW